MKLPVARPRGILGRDGSPSRLRRFRRKRPAVSRDAFISATSCGVFCDSFDKKKPFQNFGTAFLIEILFLRREFHFNSVEALFLDAVRTARINDRCHIHCSRTAPYDRE